MVHGTPQCRTSKDPLLPGLGQPECHLGVVFLVETQLWHSPIHTMGRRQHPVSLDEGPAAGVMPPAAGVILQGDLGGTETWGVSAGAGGVRPRESPVTREGPTWDGHACERASVPPTTRCVPRRPSS